MKNINVFSIFSSLNGEVNLYHQGSQATFLRLAGCNLSSCNWCDTSYALKETDGKWKTIEDVASEIKRFDNSIITITGGEPLLQEEAVMDLINYLGNSFVFSIETNGSIVPRLVGGRRNVSLVMDWKLFSSGMESKMNLDAFSSLTDQDFVKFVVKNREDFEEAVWMKSILKDSSGCEAKFVFSPVIGELKPSTLASFFEEYEVKDAILNLQLHKIIWENSLIER